MPVLASAITLVAAGIASASFLLYVAPCTLVMVLTMRGMGHGAAEIKIIKENLLCYRLTLRNIITATI